MLAETALPSMTGQLTFTAVGTSLKVYLGGALKLFAHDNVLTAAGGVGMRGSAGGTLDDFSVAAVKQYQTTVPFTDTYTARFGAPVTGTQPSVYYSEKAGNFLVKDGKLTNNAGTSVAVLNTADVTVNVDINLAYGSDKSVGLYARYSGDGEGSGYLAEAFATKGLVDTITLSIYRRQGGNWTRLTTITTTDNVGTLTFAVSGSTLGVAVDGKVLLTAIDTTFATGRVGVRLSGPQDKPAVSVDNFKVTAGAAGFAFLPPGSAGYNTPAPVATPGVPQPGPQPGPGPRGHDYFFKVATPTFETFLEDRDLAADLAELDRVVILDKVFVSKMF